MSSSNFLGFNQGSLSGYTEPGGYTSVLDGKTMFMDQASLLDRACRLWRVGDRLMGDMTMFVGVPNANEAKIKLPLGLHINKELYRGQNQDVGNQSTNVGSWASLRTATAVLSPSDFGVVFFDGSDPQFIYFAYRSSGNQYLKEASSSIWSNNTIINFTFNIPIAQWAP